MQKSRIWMFFVALAGLCWGVYVPLAGEGTKELSYNGFAALLWVGVAYFLIAVLFPIGVLWARGKGASWNAGGVTFATLAGVAGAVGALGVVFAVGVFHGPKIFVAPVIFALAPVINTLVSLFWHPDQGALKIGPPPEKPHWSLYFGILLAAAGAGLVLLAKELSEPPPKAPVAQAPASAGETKTTGKVTKSEAGTITVKPAAGDAQDFAITDDKVVTIGGKLSKAAAIKEDSTATVTTDTEGKITAVEVKPAAPATNPVYLVFVLLAGLSWGVYVPLIAQGGKALKSSYASFLCVGAAYFLIAILFPLGMFATQGFPTLNVTGSTLATLAGAAGAVGALCVIFATFEFKGPRIYVAPVIFALAPIINTVVSLFWHPTIDAPATFGPPQELPHWLLFVGIVAAGLGAGLVLFAKELGEVKHAAHLKHAPAGPASVGPAVATSEAIKP